MRSLRLIGVLLAIAFLGVAIDASASLYLTSGKYTFNVRVTNRYFKDISMARGNVMVSGTSATINVSADGYRSGSTHVFLNTNSTNTHYYCDVRLDDPTVWVNLKDDAHMTIPGGNTSYYSQSMYWADEFGITGRFPKAGFEKITTRDFDVRVNYMFSFLPKIYLSDSGTDWRFEVVVKRRDMREFSNNIDILVKRTPAEIPPATPTARVAALELARDYVANLELAARFRDGASVETLQTRFESIARDLHALLPVLSAEEREEVIRTLPAQNPLTKELKAVGAFELLHN